MFIPKQIYFVNLFIYFYKCIINFFAAQKSCKKRNYYNFILNIYLLNIGYNLNLDYKCSSFGSFIPIKELGGGAKPCKYFNLQNSFLTKYSCLGIYSITCICLSNNSIKKIILIHNCNKN